MDNKWSYIIAGSIVTLILGDVLLNGGTYLLFLMKKFMDLIVWVAFWR